MHFEQDFVPGGLTSGQTLYRAWRVYKPDAVVVLVHGLSEHSGFYDYLGHILTSANIALYAFDMPGHGEEPGENNAGDMEGWQDVSGGLSRFLGFVEQEEPRKPLFLLGSGLGGLAVLDRVWNSVTEELHGIILHNTWYPSDWILRSLSLSTRFRRARKSNPALRKRVLNLLNRDYQPAKTDYDWLSRNLETSLAFSDDPACDIALSNRLVREWCQANLRVKQMMNEHMARQPVPSLLLYGGDNPITDNGRDAERLAAVLEKGGCSPVDTALFPLGRHQILADSQQKLVIQKLVDWITHLAGPFSVHNSG